MRRRGSLLFVSGLLSRRRMASDVRRINPIAQAFHNIGGGVSVPLFSAVQHTCSGLHRRAHHRVRQVVGDISGREFHSGDEPAFPFAAVVVLRAHPRQRRIARHQRQEERAAVVIEFVEGVIPIGDFTGVTGDVERFHNSICEQVVDGQPGSVVSRVCGFGVWHR